ncbi:MAG: hypothetical protein H0X40_13875 [Chthoniobacterales bacterium]|nr:hypothetical protein [Chthoniobacterales bacterium]
MSGSTYPAGDLLFHWERPRRRRLAIAGFILASLGLHALCFLLFQVIYPPTISLLPPPARVSVIAPTSDEARSYLQWLAAEDPALASQTQRPAETRAYQLPKLAHIPSYTTVPPQLRQLPPRPAKNLAVSAMPPAPVPMNSLGEEPPSVAVRSTIAFSGALQNLAATQPDLKFHPSTRDAPEDSRFRIAVDTMGVVRYSLLESSSGDSALDDQARRYLALCRFARTTKTNLPNDKLIWATAAVNFGNDLITPPAAERAP